MTHDEEKAVMDLQILLNHRIDGIAHGELSNHTMDTIFDEVLCEDHGIAVRLLKKN